MKGNESIRVLLSKIENSLNILEEIYHELNIAYKKDIVLIGKTNRAAVMIAAIIENYYTCLETIFLRISQYFENDLPKERWHKELLERMTLTIDEVRPAVISPKEYGQLQELMRFRHFKRYYFAFSYDWQRVEEMIQRIEIIHPAMKERIGAFQEYLRKLLED